MSNKNNKNEVKEQELKTKKEVETHEVEKERSLFKRYLILIFIFILCMGLVIYLCKWYKVYDDYQKEIPVIRDTLSEITDVDLEHYILDNPSTIIYMCTASDEVCRDFEKDFKKLVIKKEYTDKIVYLNLSGLDQDKFVEEFNSKYNFKIKLTTDYPAIVMFEDGKITSLLQENDKRDFTISTVKDYLELNMIGE